MRVVAKSARLQRVKYKHSQGEFFKLAKDLLKCDNKFIRYQVQFNTNSYCCGHESRFNFACLDCGISHFNNQHKTFHICFIAKDFNLFHQ